MSPPKNFIEFIEQPALDEIVDITTNVVMKAELYEIESCKHEFGTNLYILGLKKDNQGYVLQATELLDSLNSHYQAQAYTNIGIFCIDSERSVLRDIGIQCLQRAFEAWIATLKSKSMKEIFFRFVPLFSILPALAEAGLSEQYAECKAAYLESILALSSDVIPMKLAYFANTLVKVEDEETILGYFQLIESRLPDPKESILRTIYVIMITCSLERVYLK